MKALKEALFGNPKSTIAGIVLLLFMFLVHTGKIQIEPATLNDIGGAVTAIALLLYSGKDKLK